jgi:hypothetical protein
MHPPPRGQFHNANAIAADICKTSTIAVAAQSSTDTARQMHDLEKIIGINATTGQNIINGSSTPPSSKTN